MSRFLKPADEGLLGRLLINFAEGPLSGAHRKELLVLSLTGFDAVDGSSTGTALSGPPFPNNATGHDAAGHLCRYPGMAQPTTFLGYLFILTRLDQRPRRICSGC
jgi:hypothetical protein